MRDCAIALRNEVRDLGLYLPQDELVAELGETCALAILGAFGGRQLYVPTEPGPDHDITKAIGAENAAKLAAMLRTGIGGLWVEFPLGRASHFKRTRHRIGEMTAAGASEREIATELKVHVRTVRRERARLRDQAA